MVILQYYYSTTIEGGTIRYLITGALASGSCKKSSARKPVRARRWIWLTVATRCWTPAGRWLALACPAHERPSAAERSRGLRGRHRETSLPLLLLSEAPPGHGPSRERARAGTKSKTRAVQASRRAAASGCGQPVAGQGHTSDMIRACLLIP